MRIGILAPFISSSPVTARWISALPQEAGDEYVLISADTAAAELIAPTMEWVQQGPPMRSVLTLQLWLKLRLPRLLKKLRIEKLIAFNGIGLLQKSLPQQMLMWDDAYHTGSKKEADRLKVFWRKNRAALVESCTSFVCSSQHLQALLALPEEKTRMEYPVIGNGFTPLSWEDREAVKQQLTEGKEYFLYCAETADWAAMKPLLQAFSLFKIRQRTNMILVLMSRRFSQELSEKLLTYKFRSEVLLLPFPEKKLQADYLASAYALLSPVCAAAQPLHVLEAMHCGVPAVVLFHPLYEELLGDAALYTDAATDNMADQIKRLYKDENLRNSLVQAALEQRARQMISME